MGNGLDKTRTIKGGQMSTWTHVDGFITFNADRYTDVKELKKKIKKILGPDTDAWYLTHKELED